MFYAPTFHSLFSRRETYVVGMFMFVAEIVKHVDLPRTSTIGSLLKFAKEKRGKT